MEILEPRGVIVVIECEHLCMTMRGVRKPGSKTITSAVRGQLRNAATRAEAMSLIIRPALVSALGARTAFSAGAKGVDDVSPAVSSGRGLPRRATLIMGVVNVTPDSFSDGGEFLDPDAAIAHGLELIAEGADILDVGGESTRPGAVRPTTEDELPPGAPGRRARWRGRARWSASTPCASVVAAAAIEAGARCVNDVSGGRAEPGMLRVVADAELPYVCMHWRGHSADMESLAVYDDVVAEVIARAPGAAGRCVAAGIAADRLVADPGLGFAKDAEHNWELLQRLGEFDALGVPLVVGASRKRFLGSLLAGSDGSPRPARQRDGASAALTTLLTERGVWGVRVHAVRASRDAVETVQRFTRVP